jgi:hypothetical protein
MHAAPYRPFSPSMLRHLAPGIHLNVPDVFAAAVVIVI